MKKKSRVTKWVKLSRLHRESLVIICSSVAVLMIALIVIFGFIATSVSQKNVRNFYKKVGEGVVHRHDDYFDSIFETFFSVFDSLALCDEIKSGDSEIALKTLEQTLPPKHAQVNDVFYATSDGQATSILGNSLNVSDANFFKRAMAGDDSYILELFNTGFNSEDEFVLAKGFNDVNRKRQGVFFYAMRYSFISSAVAGMNMGDVFTGFAVSQNGDFIVPLEKESILNSADDSLCYDDLLIKTEFFNRIKDAVNGDFLFDMLHFSNEYVVWAKLDNTDWVIGVNAQLSKIDAGANVFRNEIKILCLFLILCTIVVTFIVYLSLSKKLSSHRLTLHQEHDIDDLTGLWTEALFEEEVEKLLKENPNKNYLLMGLDIRGFRIVQQTEGITVANEQLIMLAKRLREIAHQKKGYAARGHIDHFYVIYPIKDKETALKEFDAMLYNGNFLAGRAGELIPTKTGLVFVGTDYEKDTIQNLIGKTSYAKHVVQDNLLKNYSVYDRAMEENVIKDKRIERYIPIAFSHDEFYVVYQPKVNLIDGRVIGAEALVRWSSAELGNVMPNSFISLFERNGYINRLDFYVYKKVFDFIERRITNAKPIVPISVNMSRFHLSDKKFVEKFYNLFRTYNISSDFVEVEILERSLGASDDRAREVAEELHEKGFRVAIDDFGTGESSLNVISKIPADVLKLDRKFMLEIENSKGPIDEEFNIVKEIVEIAKSLGKETICEGVETEHQINFLRSISCNYVQGYFYSKPLNEKDFVEYLETHI